MKEEKNIKKFNENARTPCECWSRSMGFVRPISFFNIGKRAEFEERNTFKEVNCLTAGARHQELMKEKFLKKAA